LRDPDNWQQWSELNHQLMEQWKKLLQANEAISPTVSSAPALPTPEESSDRFSSLSAIADDILAVFETGRGCTYLSPNWERITGRTVRSCLRSDFYACLHPDHIKPFVTALQQAVCEGNAQLALVPQQFQFLHADGSVRWYALKLGEVKNLAGGQQQLICGLKDMHEAHQSQRAVSESRREMQLALQARSEFLNAMSHELRTPLNAILGFTQIMESGMYGDITNLQYRDYLRHIRESGYELLAQIDEVMEMATVETGGTVVKPDVCDLSELLNQVLALHRAQTRATNLSIVCEVPPGYAKLSIDRAKLQHCISHIMANAVRFSTPGGQIRVASELNENREIVLSVTDNGTGMSARKLHTLVGALQKEDSWSARNVNGLGVGLALAKEYAKLHGGYLTIESRAGLGTRVSVHLPAECVVAQDDKVIQYAAYVS
jgi:PAS domain S-box-containing protein